MGLQARRTTSGLLMKLEQHSHRVLKASEMILNLRINLRERECDVC